MEQYIPKSALLAEIEKLKGKVSDSSSYCNGWQQALRMLELSLNTLEVKEVNLEEELESFAYTLPHSAIGDGEHLGKFDDPKVKEARKHGWSHLWRYNYVKEIAKHFFELGLKAQKGEEV